MDESVHGVGEARYTVCRRFVFERISPEHTQAYSTASWLYRVNVHEILARSQVAKLITVIARLKVVRRRAQYISRWIRRPMRFAIKIISKKRTVLSGLL